MSTKEHVCLYTEDYRTVSEYEPSLIHLGLSCKVCGAWMSATGKAADFEDIPKGTYSIKGQSEAERKESIKKSNTIRNPVRAKMGLAPLGDDGYPIDTTPEQRDKNFKELMENIWSNL